MYEPYTRTPCKVIGRLVVNAMASGSPPQRHSTKADHEVATRRTRFKTSESQHTYPVLLEHPVSITNSKKHTVVVKLTNDLIPTKVKVAQLPNRTPEHRAKL
jgi:hypothetical protein